MGGFHSWVGCWLEAITAVRSDYLLHFLQENSRVMPKVIIFYTFMTFFYPWYSNTGDQVWFITLIYVIFVYLISQVIQLSRKVYFDSPADYVLYICRWQLWLQETFWQHLMPAMKILHPGLSCLRNSYIREWRKTTIHDNKNCIFFSICHSHLHPWIVKTRYGDSSIHYQTGLITYLSFQVMAVGEDHWMLPHGRTCVKDSFSAEFIQSFQISNIIQQLRCR